MNFDYTGFQYTKLEYTDINGGKYWTISEYTKLFQIIQNYTGPITVYKPTWKYTRINWTIFDNAGIYWPMPATLQYIGPLWGIAVRT